MKVGEFVDVLRRIDNLNKPITVRVTTETGDYDYKVKKPDLWGPFLFAVFSTGANKYTYVTVRSVLAMLLQMSPQLTMRVVFKKKQTFKDVSTITNVYDTDETFIVMCNFLEHDL